MCGCNISIIDIQSLMIIITIISVLGSSSPAGSLSTLSPSSVLEKSSSIFLLLLNFNSMATIAKFSAIKPTYADLASITKTSYTFFSFLPNYKPNYCKQNLAVAANFVNSRRHVIKATSSSAASSGAVKKSTDEKGDERVQKVHSIEEFDEALRVAKNKLVVVEYAASHSLNSSNIYPFMVDLSRTCSDVNFLLVMGDESEKTQELCKREKIDRVPHFSFYKNMEKIHEEEGIGPDQLVGDVLYYGDNHSAVVQLHSREDVEKLIDEHKTDNKLIVLDVGLKHCGPCVKVYPTVLKLSKQMDAVVFARMNGDENESCMQFLKDMDVIQVPTFLFIRDGEICGRYVGSGKGELIGEILRYQGVRVT